MTCPLIIEEMLKTADSRGLKMKKGVWDHTGIP